MTQSEHLHKNQDTFKVKKEIIDQEALREVQKNQTALFSTV